MSKNIVVCLDGTGNEVKARAVTNVFKVAQYVDLKDPAAQVLYYDPGVGTMPATGAWTFIGQKVSLLTGLALGHGMRQNIAEAYTYLMNTWQPGDKVFVFGFSRGAYTARALCGMLYRVGLLRPGSENLVPYAVKVYARNPGKDSDLERPEGWDRMDRFSEALAVRTQGERRSFPIEYLGIYDTVKATRFLWRDISWPYTLSLPNVRFVRHAISIDEKRRKYAEYRVVPNREKYKRPEDVREVWFAGVHSDVGGGFVDNPELGKITMRWIMDGAIKAGLIERPVRYRRNYSLNESDATKDMHDMPWYWRFAQAPWYWVAAPWRRRPIRDGETIHSSVKTRMADKALNYAPQLPSSYNVDDEPWTGPPPKGSATAPDTDDPDHD
jgi:uncharacterized protein (DUF2235 family)